MSSESNDSCRRIEPLTGPFSDGALDPTETVQVEEHIASCSGCRERVMFTHALRRSVKRSASDALPADIRARLVERVRAEEKQATVTALASAPARAEPIERMPSLASRALVPVAAAAALALVWGSLARRPAAGSDGELVRTAGFADDVVHDLVAEHSRPLPPERTDPREVRQLERYVGVPVRVPRFRARKDMRFVGGRVLAVNHERTAMLQYEVGEGAAAQRVSVFVYDPRRITMVNPALAPRAVGSAQVRVGSADGYSVAVVQHDGVGYALASDLDPDSSAELAALADYVDP